MMRLMSEVAYYIRSLRLFIGCLLWSDGIYFDILTCRIIICELNEFI